MLNVNITESAQVYLAGLLRSKIAKALACACLSATQAHPKPKPVLPTAAPASITKKIWLLSTMRLMPTSSSAVFPFLDEAKVDFAEDKFGGQLTIRAPNSRLPNVSDDSPIEDKINYLLYNDINPGLASHGGVVSLSEMAEGIAVLEFGGGCQGCSAVSLTLKEGVEKTLMEKIPELKGVRDVTDHTDTTNAYM